MCWHAARTGALHACACAHFAGLNPPAPVGPALVLGTCLPLNQKSTLLCASQHCCHLAITCSSTPQVLVHCCCHQAEAPPRLMWIWKGPGQAEVAGSPTQAQIPAEGWCPWQNWHSYPPSEVGPPTQAPAAPLPCCRFWMGYPRQLKLVSGSSEPTTPPWQRHPLCTD